MGRHTQYALGTPISDSLGLHDPSTFFILSLSAIALSPLVDNDTSRGELLITSGPDEEVPTEAVEKMMDASMVPTYFDIEVRFDLEDATP